MNPDTPMTPREETEMRLTALLMGELPPEEAAALHAQMAADPELAALHRAAAPGRRSCCARRAPSPSTPQHRHRRGFPANAASDCSRISKESRPRLRRFVRFSQRRDWSWVVPLGLAASLIALLGGTVLMNGFSVRNSAPNRADEYILAFDEAESLGAEPARWGAQTRGDRVLAASDYSRDVEASPVALRASKSVGRAAQVEFANGRSIPPRRHRLSRPCQPPAQSEPAVSTSQIRPRKRTTAFRSSLRCPRSLRPLPRPLRWAGPTHYSRLRSHPRCTSPPPQRRLPSGESHLSPRPARRWQHGPLHPQRSSRNVQ